MRNTLIFPGNSCPGLTAKICENLGMLPAEAELTQFSNVSIPLHLLCPGPGPCLAQLSSEAGIAVAIGSFADELASL
jgi:hypothetical protein